MGLTRPDFPKAIDSSMRKAFTSCPMKAYYEYFLHLKKKGGSIHLHFGGALAYGCERFRKAYYTEGADFDGALAEGVRAIIEFWGDYLPPEGSKKTLESCILALYEYFLEFHPKTDAVQPLITENGAAIEFTFALPIPGTKHPQTGEPILYYGRFDMLGVYNKAVFVVDEKTTGYLGGSWASSYRLASQMTGYVWAAQQFGHSVQGAIIRGIAPLKNETKFQMLIEQRPKWMVERWIAQLHRDLGRMVESWESGVFDYDLDTSCGAYGGCPYLDLCGSSHPERWIDSLYEVNVWDPLEKFEEKQKEVSQ